MKKNKQNKNIIRAVLIIVLIVAAVITFCVPNFLRESKTVSIKQGLSTTDISEVLKDEGIISSKYVFLLRVTLSQYRGKLKYGDFEFSPDDGYSDIIKKLATGGKKKETVTITVPEGYSVEKIIELIEDKGIGTKQEIQRALNDEYNYEFLKKINVPKECNYRFQGFLFPSTYEFYADATPYEVIDRMLLEFEKQYKTTGASYDNLFEAITKASMIEREAKTDGDRTMIAGVIENRLNKNMKLQIDATVMYAITDGLYDADKVYYKDLDKKSPYNTYANTGLPVGPIANPGIKSIKAALSPAHHDYLYYRTDENKNDGSHVFSKNFEEHKTAND